MEMVNSVLNGNIILLRQGKKYTKEHVNTIYRQLQEHEPQRKVYCLSDQTGHLPETIPMKTELTGWWAKMELFAPWNAHLRPLLYVDLDVFVMKPLGDMFDQCGNDLWMLRDFYRPNGGCGSMLWVPKDTSLIWSRWEREWEDALRNIYSDQEFLQQFPFNRFQDLFAGHMSYKADNLQKGPREAVTVHFHGEPKPWDISHGWVKEHYERYATEVYGGNVLALPTGG